MARKADVDKKYALLAEYVLRHAPSRRFTYIKGVMPWLKRSYA